MRSLIAGVLGFVLVVGACVNEGGVGSVTTLALSASSTTLAPDATTSTNPQSTTTTTAFVPAGPGYGGTAVVGDDQEPPTLNPLAPGGDNFIVAKIAQAVHVGVWDVDGATLELIPEAVTELPTVNNGGLVVNDDGTLTVRYQIRDEAQWADGTPISGDDFLFTYRLLTDAEIAAATLTRFDRENPYELIIPGSIVAGPKTFTYSLRQATVEWEMLFGIIVPRHQVEDTDFLADWNTVPWVSGGPFVFESWVPGEAVRVVRNESYWKMDPATGLQLPYLDAVEFRFIPETSVLIRAFTSREIDILNPPPSPQTIRQLRQIENVEVTVSSGPIWEHFNFQFGPNNRNADSLNRYVLFRRAVAYALDREAIVDDITSGFGYGIDSYLDAFTPGWSSQAWSRYPYDPDLARDLISQLCAELERDCTAQPPTLVFSTTSNGDIRIVIANLLEEMLEEVGIDVELELEDSSIYFGKTLDYGTWDMGLWAWVGTPGLAGLVAIHDIFDPDGPPPDGQNFYRWGTLAVTGSEEPGFDQGPSSVIDEHTERFAEIREAMQETVDRDQILDLVRQAESILADQVVIIPIYGRLDLGAVWADEIGGYVHNPSQASDTWNIESWYRVDRQ